MEMRPIVLLFVRLMIVASEHAPFNIDELDRSISPADDFFSFVNARWLNQTVLPLSKTILGGIYRMTDENQFKLKTMLDNFIRTENVTHSNHNRSIHQQLTDFYRVGLDEQAIERAGIEPLRATLTELERIEHRSALIEFVLDWYQQTNQDLLVHFEVQSDHRNASTNAVVWLVRQESTDVRTCH
jgi:putative endopeptidase